MMRGLSFAISFFALSGLAAFTNADAVFPDITGTFEGDRTQTRFNCTGPGGASWHRGSGRPS